MLKNYVTVALRTLRRHPGYALINGVGLAVGITCCIMGAECLVVQKAVFSRPAAASEPGWHGFPQQIPKRQEFQPPEWAPWSLITAGTVIVIYSVTLKTGGEG